jgi:hypothetical protein
LNEVHVVDHCRATAGRGVNARAIRYRRAADDRRPCRHRPRRCRWGRRSCGRRRECSGTDRLSASGRGNDTRCCGDGCGQGPDHQRLLLSSGWTAGGCCRFHQEDRITVLVGLRRQPAQPPPFAGHLMRSPLNAWTAAGARSGASP